MVNQTVRSWTYGKQREIGIRKVYPRRNVIQMANWNLARATRDLEIATDHLKFVEAVEGIDAEAEAAERQAFVIEVAAAIIDLFRAAPPKSKGKKKRCAGRTQST